MHGKIQKLRFIAMGSSLALAGVAFFSGIAWMTSVQNSADRVRISDTSREIRGKLMHLRQILAVEMQYLDADKFGQISDKAGKSNGVNMNLDSKLNSNQNSNQSFDIFLVFSQKRELSTIFRRDSKGAMLLEAKKGDLLGLIPKNSTLFDHAVSERLSSGVLTIEGKPSLIGVKPLYKGQDLVGFLVAARKIDMRRLAPTASMAEQSFDVFVPDPKVAFPLDVDEAKKSMVGDERSVSKLLKRGLGLGYVRFEDVFEQTSFILRYKWADSSPANDKKSLGWLFVFAMGLGGLVHLVSSAVITWIVRKRKQTPGLSGLSDWELNATVESFPGYAFAIDHLGHYIAVSRSFAGRLGKEPSELIGKKVSSSMHNGCFDGEKVFAALSKSKNWPAVELIDLEVSGLGHLQKFTGSAHMVPQRSIAFCLVTDERHSSESKNNSTETSSHMSAA